MMKTKLIYVCVLFVFFLFKFEMLYSQAISGYVYEEHNNHKDPLVGVNVYWLNTTDGVATDVNGYFLINKNNDEQSKLVFSYVGYLNDTIEVVNSDAVINVVLNASKYLKETVIEARAAGTHVSRIEPIFKEVITQGEIQRAACCNLSESFETNASVDVSYSDAVTGAKQIQLLGLSGTYSQILTENMPSVRGPAIPYGLLYVPGPWMESIQISKGTASVINGYESITGQINVEYLKPEAADKLFFNMYANDLGKIESSITSAHKINDRWHTMVLLHGEYLDKANDHNEDSFMDHPLVSKYNFFNRYKYDKPGKMESIFGFKVMDEDRQAGQIMKSDISTQNLYNVNIRTKRYEAFAKTGFFFANKPGTSLGTIFSASYHDQKSVFGNNKYDVLHKNFYANIIYETSIYSSFHKLNIGPSFSYDNYNELIIENKQISEEVVPGFFTQYTYNNSKNITVILGLRYDYNNLYGSLITPRTHLKYDLTPKLTFRASAGKGYRAAYVIAENPFLLMNSRKLFFDNKLDIEEAYNYGGSFTYDFSIVGKESNVSVEFYRTDFINQVIIDLERNVNEIHIYNLDGISYSNSFQTVFSTEIFRGFDFTAAFRWNDVKTTINDNLISKPMVNKYKGLITLSYLTQNSKWQFDFTSQFNGKSRLPDTSQLPQEYQKKSHSPAYTVMLGQVAFKTNKFDVYFGGENLTSYVQKNPIIAAHDPFGDYFDTTFIWGPIYPRMFYAGVRFVL